MKQFDPKTPRPRLRQVLTAMTRVAKEFGTEVAVVVIAATLAMADPRTSKHDRIVLLTALSYLLVAVDAVPDMLPGGLVDDVAALATAVAAVGDAITAEHRDRARRMLRRWLADDGPSPVTA